MKYYKYYLEAKIKVWLELSNDTLDYLLECCKKHYDSGIKSIAEEGGFLYKIKSWRIFMAVASEIGDDNMVELTFREVDKLHKSIELETTPLSYTLREMFQEICNNINVETVSINNKYKNS